MTYEQAIEKVYNLKRDRSGTHERPHKPVLLLTLLDLIESGKGIPNQFQLNDQLFSIWRAYFEAVRKGNDQPTIENPLFFLSGDGVWRLIPKSGIPEPYQTKSGGGAPSRRWLKDNILYGQLDPDFFNIISSPVHLAQTRDAIISRFFPEHRNILLKLSGANLEKQPGDENSSTVKETPERDSAFRKLILHLYDKRCTACGLRLIVDDVIIVDAAHLIPWSQSHNDHPSNGITLCKNHHWAMDRNILAPGPDRKWHVSVKLDRRINDHRDLIELDGHPLFEPQEEIFLPSESCLLWRYERLLA